MNGSDLTEAGVNALVDRLHRDGVEAGRREADRLIAAARTEADAIVTAAKAERDLMLSHTRQEVEALRHAGEAALRLALRDTQLRAREELLLLLAERLGARVRDALASPALLADLIGWAARRMTGEGVLTVELGLSSAEGAGEEGDAAKGGDALARLAGALTADLLEEKPLLRLGSGQHAGVVLRGDTERLAVDLTDETITAFLFAQLQPRFRALFEGTGLA